MKGSHGGTLHKVLIQILKLYLEDLGYIIRDPAMCSDYQMYHLRFKPDVIAIKKVRFISRSSNTANYHYDRILIEVEANPTDDGITGKYLQYEKLKKAWTIMVIDVREIEGYKDLEHLMLGQIWKYLEARI